MPSRTLALLLRSPCDATLPPPPSKWGGGKRTKPREPRQVTHKKNPTACPATSTLSAGPIESFRQIIDKNYCTIAVVRSPIEGLRQIIDKYYCTLLLCCSRRAQPAGVCTCGGGKTHDIFSIKHAVGCCRCRRGVRAWLYGTAAAALKNKRGPLNLPRTTLHYSSLADCG